MQVRPTESHSEFSTLANLMPVKPRRTHKPNIAMRDYRRIDRLIAAQQSDWPADLLVSAGAARSVLFIIARNPPEKIEALRQFKAKHGAPPDYVSAWDVMMKQAAEFYQRYVQWKARRSV